MVITENSLDDSTTASNPRGAGTPDGEGRPWWPLTVAVIAVLLAVSLLIPAGRHQWAISIFRQPTDYTTLSFRNAAGLPEAINAGARVHLSFTVANHEGRRMEYPYVVSSKSLDDRIPGVLRRAALPVADGGQRTESVTVKPRCTTSPCRLQISLPGHPETIDVLLNVHQPKG
jgi:hypothetical protein